MKDDDESGERPSMKATLGLVVNNDPRSKNIRDVTDDLDRLTRSLAGDGMDIKSFGPGQDDDDEEPLLEEAELVILAKPSSVMDYRESDVSEDYRYSRQMLYTLLHEGGLALASALRLAKQSQHPRAFEIVNSMTNTMRDLTKDLMVLQKAFNDVTAGKEEMKKLPGAVDGQAALPEHEKKMSGTTADILRLVKEAQGVTSEQKTN